MEPNVPVITIDGPGGSGKGTIAKRVAEKLGWRLLDSGALYRLLALAARNHHVDLSDEQTVTVLAGALDVQFSTGNESAATRIFLEGEDVTEEIRSEEIGAEASTVARISTVRDALLERQRAFAQLPGLVADGRDMGTIVFDKAPLKVYLTASVESRAKRRQKQLLEMGQSDTLARLTEAIAARDRSDMERVVAPLKPAIDAFQIDSTDLSIEQVCQLVFDEVSRLNLDG